MSSKKRGVQGLGCKERGFRVQGTGVGLGGRHKQKRGTDTKKNLSLNKR